MTPAAHISSRHDIDPRTWFLRWPAVATALALLLWGASQSIAQDVETIQDETPVAIGGSINLLSSFYSISSGENRQTPFTWTISGTVTPSVYGISMPLSLTLSEQERSFRQPFNQFGISPRYKWINAHAGYRALSFDNYALAGAQFLGGGIELSPGTTRLGAMYGRFQRAVEEDSNQQSAIPAYERWGYALKAGFETTHLSMAIDWFHAADDTNSLVRIPRFNGVTPQENSVLGLETRISIVPGILTVEGEVAGSIFTRDLRSPDIDISKTPIPDFVTEIHRLTLSTTFTIAARASMMVQFDDWGLRVGFQHIEPEFTSLGAYYFNTDIDSWSIAPSVRLFDGAVRLGGQLELQHDDLLNQKSVRSNRVNGVGNLQWQPFQEFGIDLGYAAASTDQTNGRSTLSEITRQNNITRSFTVAPRLMLSSEQATHGMSLMINYQDYTDRNVLANGLGDNQSLSASTSYTRSSMESPDAYGGSLNYSHAGSTIGGSTVIGLSLNVTKALLAENALSLIGTLTTSHTSVSNSDQPGTLSFAENISSTYRLSADDQLTLTAYMTQVQASEFAPGFMEFNTQLGYTHSFY